MNYLKIYNNLIQKAKMRINFNDYTETHHIIPDCFYKTSKRISKNRQGWLDGDSYDPNNLVNLTFKEHFVAHHLLTKIYPNNNKLQYAFLCMLRDPRGHRKQFFTAKMYEIIKKSYSSMIIKKHKNKEFVLTEKGRKILSDNIKGDKNPMTRFPERNHTVKKITVFYLNGTIVNFNMLKDFKKTIPKMSKYKLAKQLKNESFLHSIGIDKIEIEQKETASQKRKWYTNGITNVYIKDNDIIPKGFNLGMAPYSRITNGKQTGRIKEKENG